MLQQRLQFMRQLPLENLFMREWITVTGDAIANPGNFKVKNGTNAAELVEAAGGFKSQPEKVISGGPMMGMALST